LRRRFASSRRRPEPRRRAATRSLGELRQRGGKRIVAWALEGDFDVARLASNTFELEWPPRSGRLQRFPEIDRAAWVDCATARRKLVPAQAPFVDALQERLSQRAQR
jgi:predicted NUDIX family NTP pyrophosphohydrolase